MHKTNHELREYARQNGVCMWQLADFLGLGETKLCRLLRYPLSANESEKYFKAIDAIINERGSSNER